MAIYRVKCTICDWTKAKMLQSSDEIKSLKCQLCDAPVERDIGAPSTQVMESIDNGVMAHRVVRLKDAVDLTKAHIKTNPKKQP